MKFRMIHLGYRQTPDYPYDYRIELIQYQMDELEALDKWIDELEIPHTRAGRNSGILYMREKDAMLFALRWA